MFASLFYLFCPELLVSVFGSGKSGVTNMDFEKVVRYVIIILHFAVVFNLLDATRFITMGSLRGAGDTKVPLYIGVSTSWLIQIPGTLYLVYYAHAGLASIWCLLTFYIGIDAALMVYRRQTGAWKNIRVIDLPPAPPEELEEEIDRTCCV